MIYIATPLQTDWPLFIGANSALVFLLIVAVSLMGWRSYRLRKGNANPLEFSEVFSTQLPPSDARDLFKRTMLAMDIAVQREPSGESNFAVEGRQGMTRRSWGQWLLVEPIDPEEHPKEWRVTSWPTFEGTLFDRGQGRRVVNSFLQGLKELDPTVLASPSDPGPDRRSRNLRTSDSES